MWIYYNQFGNLTTKIPHGEVIRQGTTFNLYIAVDKLYFKKSIEDSTDRVFLSFTLNEIKDWINNYVIATFKIKDTTIETPLIAEVIQFRKLKTSEMVFDLIDKENYIVFHFTGEHTLISNSGNYEAVLKLENRYSGTITTMGLINFYVEKTYGGSTGSSGTGSNIDYGYLEENYYNKNYIDRLKADKSEIVDLTTSQTITSNKTIAYGNKTNYAINSGNLFGISGNQYNYLQIDYNGAGMYSFGTKQFFPNSNNSRDLGTSSLMWKDLYLSGNISNGTYSVTIADIAKKSDIPTDYVDLTSAQEISGVKTFGTIKVKYPDATNFFQISPDSNGYNVKFSFGSSVLMMLHNGGVTSYRDILPDSNNSRNLGSNSVQFKNLYLSGVVSDGTNSISVANITNKNDVYTKTQTTDIINNASGVSKFAWKVLSTDTREGITLDFNKEYKLYAPYQTESNITVFSLTIPIEYTVNSNVSSAEYPNVYKSANISIPLEYDLYTQQCTFKIYNTVIETEFESSSAGVNRIVFTYEMNGVRKTAVFQDSTDGIGGWTTHLNYPNGYGPPVFQQLSVGGSLWDHTLYVANENPLSLAFKENQDIITLNPADSTTGETYATVSETGLYEFISNAYYGIAVLAYIDVHETHNNGLAGNSYKEVLVPVVVPSSDSIEITGYCLITIQPLSDGLEGNGIVRVGNLSSHVVHFRRIL